MASSTISPLPPEISAADSPNPAPAPLRAEGAGHLSLLQAVTALAREGANAEPPGSRDLLRRFRDNAKTLARTTAKLARLTAAGTPVPGETEWLLDNYYIIEEVVREVQHDLPRRYYRELPALAFGPFKGMPRIYPVAATLLGHTDSALSEPQIREVVKAYQETTPLSTGEVWAFPTMLRLALLENLRRLGDQIMATIASRDEAASAVEAARVQRVPRLPRLPSDAFIVALADRLRDNEPQPGAAADAVEAWSTRYLVDLAQARHREYSRQAANQVSIGNAVTGLRLLGVIDWAVFFEATSLVEAALRTDPGEVYPRQDFATRDRCRRAVEQLARGSGWNEIGVARAAVTAAAAQAPDPLSGQVSWFLLGDGRAEFERSLGYRPRLVDRRRVWLLAHPHLAYFGCLLGVLSLLLASAVVLSWHGVLPALLVALAVVLPASEVAVYVTNFLLCRLLPPRVLPRIDLRQGIPEDCSTFVVVPTLIGKPSQAAGLVERLEQHYLANPDPCLVIALLTDFTDAPTETTPTDEACVRGLLDGIAKLNARYAPDSATRFYLFHRKRLFDAPEGVWMGWERKRGKLQEFNDLLRGDTHTSFSTTSVHLPAIPRVRFVLTLDTDTVLPRDAARSMISAMAHPLNAPRISADGRRVEAGYGVLQPRVSFLYTTGFRSWFAKMFAGSVGIDPYSAAVSDTYMDLFGEGTFTGKGLYDVDAFRATADKAFPDNHILSHDLIESNYARCALATDVEVFDEFPARYHAFARRDHRWVRGDWQLLPWLGPTVPLPGGRRAPNVLPALGRWKIIDNLRRSLVPAGVVALVVLGGTVLPGPALGWLLLALLPFLLPPALYVLQAAIRLLTGAPARAEFARAGTDLVSTLGQSALLTAFIANQAWLCLDAIARTLWRLYVSRRHLLEWETAAATEKRLGSGLIMFVGTMWPACVIAAAGAGLVWRVRPDALLVLAPLFAVWLLSPLVAWGVSAPRRLHELALAPEQVRELRRITRKTWDFFETFVGAEDNWLPPDNFQEVPRGVVAHRTSPTNMGLYLLATLAAHDFGYVGTSDMLERLKNTLDTFDRLERHRGHFLNWYETNTLATLHPAYVSTVDSGNLLACLITLANGMVEKARFEPSDAPRQGLRDTLALVETRWAALRDKATHEVGKAVGDGLREVGDALSAAEPGAAGLARVSAAAEKLSAALASGVGDPAAPVLRWALRLVELAQRHHRDAVESAQKREAWAVAMLAIERRCREFAALMNFTFLYNPDRELFSIGFNVPAGRLDPSHYDLLASEACIASFLAVARGEVPRKHWFQLGRLATRAAGDIGLVSWGGTMFEYLMPRLLLPVPPGVLLDQAQKSAVRRQIEFGHECKLPWGVSESGFYVFDAAQVYQYQSFGVPGLGLKRGLDRDRVIAPYATLLAVDIDPVAALANLARISREGGEGAYGFFEAVDYTPSRLPEGAPNQVVRSYMAHHQGMAFLAIVNRLTGGIVRRRLRVEPAVRAAELLLAERIPYEAPTLEPHEAEAEVAVRLTTTDTHVRRRITTPDTPAPRPHLLSNGRYSVMVTNSGAGYSRCGDLDVTRWRADATADDTGTFIYVRDTRSGGMWSAGYQPVRRRSEVYEVTYSLDKADFRRIDDGVETLTEITVAADQDVEVRRVTLTNLGDEPREMEIVSYAEVVLAPHAADLAHPAFGKLFIETEWLAENSAILCRRRPRTPEQAPVWAVHVVASDAPGDVRFETDRAKFLGRRRDAGDPRGVGEWAQGATGPVLDPVVAIGRSVVVNPGEKVVVSFATGVAVSRESALALADLYNTTHAVTRVFELAWARARIELQHTQLRAEDIHLFLRLAGHLLYPTGGMRAGEDVLAANLLGQSSLWRFGISGDLPVAVLSLHSSSGLGHLRQMAQAHAVWLARGLRVDLVVLLGNAGGYLDELYTESMNLLRSSGLTELIDRPGGVFVRKASQMSREDQTLILSCARLLMDDRSGPFATQANAAVVPRPLPARRAPRSVAPRFGTVRRPAEVAFWNGYGGFGEGGREYLIAGDGADRPTPTPWINVIANPAGGFLVSDGGGGFTWAGNSQSNRLTPWSNDPVSDPAGEAIYVQDDATGAAWNPTAGPIRSGDVLVRHGQGYTTFERVVNEVHHELTVFMPAADPVKVSLLKLRNTSARPQRLNLLYYVEWVLGTQREATSSHLLTEVDAPTGALFARNPYHPEIGSHVAFLDISIRPRSVSGDRAECLGRNGSLAAPAALERVGLSGRVGAGLDPCGAVRASIQLAPGQEETVVLLLGQAADAEAARGLVRRYSGRAAAAACAAVVEKWDRICGAVQVETPDPSFDILMNRWLIYQTLSCRLWGRSAFYQSGGAYGFRDQLQDVMALLHAAPQEARAQLIRAGRHQFREGDVLHWWHEPKGNGVRTKFSDDFLWLPYAVCLYVRVTGDLNVCDVMLPYIDAPLLREDQHEAYLVPTVSEFAETLYAHCARALDNGWKLGVHGLPLMGCGDWNDGMSTVGIHGKGESVWVAWFQAVCLDLFAELADRRGDAERGHTCRTRAAELREAVERHGHDGGWYRRAYFDDGTPLGSAQNDECRIDSLTQSWAVIAGGDRERAAQGMDAVMETLVRPDDRLILLFEPPFDKGPLQPGYIKGYVPGVRENGGQYTHAGCWVVKALAELGRADEAFAAFALLDPIRATQSTQGVDRYRGEPYVLAGDVYSSPQHVGRAGWTWYTGSSSWLYRVGTEDILGLRRVGDRLRIEPCVPTTWPGFRVRYRFGETVYEIEVKISHPAGQEATRVVVDGKEQDGAEVALIDDRREHSVVVTFGATSARRAGEVRRVEATR